MGWSLPWFSCFSLRGSGADSGVEAGRSINACLVIGTHLILCPKANTGHATEVNGALVLITLLFAPKRKTFTPFFQPGGNDKVKGRLGGKEDDLRIYKVSSAISGSFCTALL